MLNRSLLTSKLKATGIHLGISGLLFVAVLYFILVQWYPGVWFADGGWQGVRIMIVVDLVLGPVLTFIILNPAKSRRTLTVDFSLIGLVQALAFAWGVHAVHQQRPVAAVFWENAFHTIDEKPLTLQGKSVSDLQAFDGRVPALIYAQAPGDAEGIMTLISKIYTNDISEFEQVQLFRPALKNLEGIFAQHTALLAAIRADSATERALKTLLQEHPELTIDDLRFVSLIGRYEEATLVFTAAGEIVGILPPVKLEKSAKT
jgi:hypothetical protein